MNMPRMDMRLRLFRSCGFPSKRQLTNREKNMNIEINASFASTVPYTLDIFVFEMILVLSLVRLQLAAKRDLRIDGFCSL